MKEYKFKINGSEYVVNVADIENNIAEVEVNGINFSVELETPVKKSPVAPKVSAPAPSAISQTVAKPTSTVSAAPVTPAQTGDTTIKSPLPGVILEISVKEGDTVKKGQKLIVLEAMKMENVIESNADGKVSSIKVAKGDTVLEGAILVTIG
jgi:biotin carboxyl carrier protein